MATIEQTGKLIVYAKARMMGKTIRIRAVDKRNARFGAQVIKEQVNGRDVYSAVFKNVPAGLYDVEYDGRDSVFVSSRSSLGISVFPNATAVVDWT